MTFRDLTDNIQAKTHARMPFAIAAPPEGLKKLDESLPRDWWTPVAYLNAHASFLANHRDTNRRVRHPVMDGIGDEIPEQLLHAFPVTGTLAVADNIQL